MKFRDNKKKNLRLLQHGIHLSTVSLWSSKTKKKFSTRTTEVGFISGEIQYQFGVKIFWGQNSLFWKNPMTIAQWRCVIRRYSHGEQAIFKKACQTFVLHVYMTCY